MITAKKGEREIAYNLVKINHGEHAGSYGLYAQKGPFPFDY
jgi:hypothetical protein